VCIEAIQALAQTCMFSNTDNLLVHGQKQVCTFLKQHVTPAPETVAELADSEPSRPGELLPQTIAYVWIDYSCVPTRSDLAARHAAAMAAAGASTSSVLTTSTVETSKPGSMRRTYSGVSAPAVTDGGTATVGATVGSGATADLAQLTAPIDHETLVSNSLTVLLRSTHFLAVPGTKAMPSLDTETTTSNTATAATATAATGTAAGTATATATANGGKSRRTSSSGKELENGPQNGLPPAPRRMSSANRYACIMLYNLT
jgi:hypothetical protein